MFVRLVLAVLAVAAATGLLVRPSSGSGPERTYVVRPHDTLWAIATANYSGDPRAAVWKLQRRNGLHGALLRPGQTLVLP